jgi:hypothetical protein
MKCVEKDCIEVNWYQARITLSHRSHTHIRNLVPYLKSQIHGVHIPVHQAPYPLTQSLLILLLIQTNANSCHKREIYTRRNGNVILSPKLAHAKTSNAKRGRLTLCCPPKISRILNRLRLICATTCPFFKFVIVALRSNQSPLHSNSTTCLSDALVKVACIFDFRTT